MFWDFFSRGSIFCHASEMEFVNKISKNSEMKWVLCRVWSWFWDIYLKKILSQASSCEKFKRSNQFGTDSRKPNWKCDRHMHVSATDNIAAKPRRNGPSPVDRPQITDTFPGRKSPCSTSFALNALWASVKTELFCVCALNTFTGNPGTRTVSVRFWRTSCSVTKCRDMVLMVPHSEDDAVSNSAW